MKARTIGAIAAAGTAGAVTVTLIGPSTDPSTITSTTIVRVIDGDTIETTAGRTRLLSLDTPEVYGHRECGGPEASARMKALLHPGYHVRLVRDPGEPDKDRYGRLLRYVMHGRSDVGRRLVSEGWAEVYEAFPASRTPEYRRFQATARRAGRGVWGLCGGFES
jgi:endonuclease YncB( thermonuclease family)